MGRNSILSQELDSRLKRLVGIAEKVDKRRPAKIAKGLTATHASPHQ
jgi:hypothetical protein